MWATHGDALSLQYAGSQALQSDVTRTGTSTSADPLGGFQMRRASHAQSMERSPYTHSQAHAVARGSGALRIVHVPFCPKNGESMIDLIPCKLELFVYARSPHSAGATQ